MKEYIKKILTVTNQELDNINLEKYLQYVNIDKDFGPYFDKKSGIEHYRLLSYISSIFKDVKLLDIGTNRGYSCIALADNPNNKVITYDLVRYEIVNKLIENPFFGNIEFKLGNFIGLEDLSNCPFIFLDTNHDGIFEIEVINHLKDIDWKGILLMDDIIHFPALDYIWKTLDLEKYDISSKGHWSGTGLVIFD